MKELLAQLTIASQEIRKTAALLIKHEQFDRANKAAWVAKALDGWKAEILLKDGYETTDEQD